ncbi:MAG TPA: hypothetical protein VE528_06180 [Thermoleophilaceae bacterium]|jgi:hypothetical protein|nr:hypothetical protein [Thermoleophilaceae bacterium]
MAKRSLVELPSGADPPFRVFVNGVPQVEGRDYRVKGRALLFDRELMKEGRLGFWRWTLMFFSIAGTYRRHDSVDVAYQRGGREHVVVGLDITPLEGPEAPARAGADDHATPGRRSRP